MDSGRAKPDTKYKQHEWSAKQDPDVFTIMVG
jgi:hypothetical protein